MVREEDFVRQMKEEVHRLKVDKVPIYVQDTKIREGFGLLDVTRVEGET